MWQNETESLQKTGEDRQDRQWKRGQTMESYGTKVVKSDRQGSGCSQAEQTNEGGTEVEQLGSKHVTDQKHETNRGYKSQSAGHCIAKTYTSAA